MTFYHSANEYYLNEQVCSLQEQNVRLKRCYTSEYLFPFFFSTMFEIDNNSRQINNLINTKYCHMIHGMSSLYV